MQNLDFFMATKDEQALRSNRQKVRLLTAIYMTEYLRSKTVGTKEVIKCAWRLNEITTTLINAPDNMFPPAC